MTWGLSGAHVDDHGRTSGATKGNSDDERRRAVRAVASRAVDAADAQVLLSMLALDAAEGKRPQVGEAT